MENVDEQIEMTAEQPSVADKETTNNDNAIYKQTEDFAAQFARWAENPLVSIAIADPRLCRFIGDSGVLRRALNLLQLLLRYRSAFV